MSEEVLAALGGVASLITVLALLLEKRKNQWSASKGLGKPEPLAESSAPSKRVRAIHDLRVDVQALHQLTMEASADQSLSPEELHRLRQLIERVQRDVKKAGAGTARTDA